MSPADSATAPTAAGFVSPAEIERANTTYINDPAGLVRWALGLGGKAIVTTNFSPYESVILDLVTKQKPDIDVVWMDGGYGTPATYRFAEETIQKMGLHMQVFLPVRTRAHREAIDGETPLISDETRHKAFTEEVKLEPFRRAMATVKPQVWFTAIRAEQTPFRASLQPVTMGADGVLKVAPVFTWTAKQMNQYVEEHGLPNNFDYFDPTKVEDKRECGLHTA